MQSSDRKGFTCGSKLATSRPHRSERRIGENEAAGARKSPERKVFACGSKHATSRPYRSERRIEEHEAAGAGKSPEGKVFARGSKHATSRHRKVVSENMKQKDRDLARSEKNRMAEAYRELRESTESKIAAGAVNDRQVDDLSRQLESAKSALELKSTEKEKSNASDEKKIMKFSQQLQDTKSMPGREDGRGKFQ